MERIPIVLQLPIVVEGLRPLATECQRLEKFDLFLTGVPTERLVVEKLFQAGF